MEPQARFLAPASASIPFSSSESRKHFKRNDSSIGICPASTFLKAMATSIDENWQNPFDNVVTESDVEVDAPDIAIVDSDADDDFDIEI